jgi:RNA polymerase sigma factor (sigma-70 family)
MSEDELVAHLLATSDIDAFGALVRLHQSSLRGFLVRMTRGNHALADDLAQETFLEAYRRIAQFRGPGTFRGWLFRIAYSRFLMTMRQRKLKPLDEADQRLARAEDSDARIDLERTWRVRPRRSVPR